MSVDRRSVLGLALASTALATTAEAAVDATNVVESHGDPSGRYAKALSDIQRYAIQHRTANALPGLTLTVVDRDGFTGFVRLGYADVERRDPVRADHLFQIGSISKSFAALCIWRLIEVDQLRLDENVQDLLPDIPLPGGAPITVQSLLNHSSGLPDDAPMFPRGGDQRLWRGFETGANWSYSNLGYQLLGEIVARRHGRPYAEVVQRDVLVPLGMKDTRAAILTRDRARYATGYSPFYDDRAYPQGGRLGPGPWVNMIAAAGCVTSTAKDMALYARYLCELGAEFEVLGVDRQQHLGDILLRRTELFGFVRANPMFQHDTAVQDRMVEERRQKVFGVLRMSQHGAREIEHACCRRRLLKFG